MQSEDFSPSADFNNYNDCSYIIQESGILLDNIPISIFHEECVFLVKIN